MRNTIHRQTGISALVSLVLLKRPDRRITTMQHTQKLVRLFALLAVVGLPALALPLAADAGVRVSVGIGVPVYPPPVVVAPPPAVLYPAPVVVVRPPVVVAPPPVVYGGPRVSVGGYYRGYYGHRPPHWRHHHHPHWRRW